MSSEVFYRKWRPQTLSEIVGQEPITITLRHAIESGKVAHAYLFCGPRGTGKTSTGRILAKTINCPNQVGGEPCNTCNICRSITEGRALDVIEIDAASNRGIDDIRRLREKVNYTPGVAPYKVYIIDEVHMLTDPACNALLKTLEEPPAHAIFVLATTEAHKVLPTIVSRCQRFNFHRLSQSAIVDKLTLICQKEDIGAGVDSLKLIARAATGSLRDAENILQQLIAYHGNQIGLDQVQITLGVRGDSRIRQLVKYIVNKDIAAGLRVINDVNNDGIDLRQFNLELVEYLRGLLLMKSGCEEALDVTSEDLAEMRGFVATITLDYLLSVVKLFSNIDFRGDNYSTLPLELALVDCALPLATAQEEPIVAKSAEKAEISRLAEEPPITSPEIELPALADNIDTISTEISQEQDIEYLRGRWKDFIAALRGEGSSGNLDALLRSACEPIALQDGTVVLGFYYSFHKNMIENPKYRHLVERKLKEVFDQPYKIQCVLVDHKREIPIPERKENPLVKAALEMGARIANTEF